MFYKCWRCRVSIGSLAPPVFAKDLQVRRFDLNPRLRALIMKSAKVYGYANAGRSPIQHQTFPTSTIRALLKIVASGWLVVIAGAQEAECISDT